METTLTFGEHMRRLRRGKRMSLHMLAEATGLSYTHLSRLENDSTMPNAATVAKLAAALDGDLKVMLELADCLPKAILDRIMGRQESGQVSLRRSSGQVPGASSRHGPFEGLAAALEQGKGLSKDEAQSIVEAVDRLARLDEKQRRAIVSLILTFSGEDHPRGGS